MSVPTIKLYDLLSNELADLTGIALDPAWSPIANGPKAFTLKAVARHTELTAIADDGYPNLRDGNRKLIVWDDDPEQPIFHGRIGLIDRSGDENNTYVTVTAWTPWAELGFGEKAGRVVRDVTGNFISPRFNGHGSDASKISGPDLIRQVLLNSSQSGSESDPTPGEGPLPIDLSTGSYPVSDVEADNWPPVDSSRFDIAVGPGEAVDLSALDFMTWPQPVGDFISEIIKTGVVDIIERPVDPSEGLDPYIMVAWSIVSKAGTDRSATVGFDYFAGRKNAKAARYIQDFFTTICNKVYDYFGPRHDDLTHWPANLTPGNPFADIDVSISRQLYGGHPATPGQFMSIREFDTLGDSTALRPLRIALWAAEQADRVEPRKLLYITAADGEKGLYVPPGDFDVFDVVGIKTGPEFGIELDEVQRVYGYTKTWTREGVAQISQLLTSTDVGGIIGGSGGGGGGGGGTTGGGGGGPAPGGGGGGSGGTPSGDPWAWDAGAATVDDTVDMSFFRANAGFDDVLASASVATYEGDGSAAGYAIAGGATADAVVHMPLGLREGASADRNFTFRDTGHGRETDLSQCSYNSGTGKLSAEFGVSMDIDAVTEPRSGDATASRIPLRRGLVVCEDFPGGINHPLVFSCSPAAISGTPASVYPGDTDFGGDAGTNGLPFGAWVRLDPAFDVAALSLPMLENDMCLAMQTYGIFLRDGSGSIANVTFYLQDRINQGGYADWQAALGESDPLPVVNPANGRHFGRHLAIPSEVWDNLQPLVHP